MIFGSRKLRLRGPDKAVVTDGPMISDHAEAEQYGHQGLRKPRNAGMRQKQPLAHVDSLRNTFRKGFPCGMRIKWDTCMYKSIIRKTERAIKGFSRRIKLRINRSQYKPTFGALKPKPMLEPSPRIPRLPVR